MGNVGNFGIVALIIFIIIRLLIAIGLLYLVVSEIRKYKKRRVKKYGEIDKDVDGKDVDSSSDSRG